MSPGGMVRFHFQNEHQSRTRDPLTVEDLDVGVVFQVNDSVWLHVRREIRAEIVEKGVRDKQRVSRSPIVGVIQFHHLRADA